MKRRVVLWSAAGRGVFALRGRRFCGLVVSSECAAAVGGVVMPRSQGLPGIHQEALE